MKSLIHTHLLQGANSTNQSDESIHAFILLDTLSLMSAKAVAKWSNLSMDSPITASMEKVATARNTHSNQ